MNQNFSKEYKEYQADKEPYGLIDIGANLTHSQFDADRCAVIEQAFNAGLQQMIITGSTLNNSQQALKLAQQYPGQLYSTAGVHPHHADEWQNTTQWETLFQQPEVKAIGETGLDFFRNIQPKDRQEKTFEAQLAFAIDTQLPIFLHQRDAHDRFFQILKCYRGDLNNAVVHCFTDTKQALFDYLDLDCHIGITGWICDERRGKHLLELVAEIPNNRLLIETDAPYLFPRDLQIPGQKLKRPQRNLPQYLPHIATKIAHCRNEPPDQLITQTTQNAIKFFQL